MLPVFPIINNTDEQYEGVKLEQDTPTSTTRMRTNKYRDVIDADTQKTKADECPKIAQSLQGPKPIPVSASRTPMHQMRTHHRSCVDNYMD